ncbi:hypothetical protein X777_11928 [Ooceraea biroi]|uniref:Uncharacterized protein n=1 Tax=Ooceraea biroi TaxID=2015173 RepID=A0A026W0F4_OOCBI|nr:hypothetical protein X777_11928 [Ooceraea biroi]
MSPGGDERTGPSPGSESQPRSSFFTQATFPSRFPVKLMGRHVVRSHRMTARASRRTENSAFVKGPPAPEFSQDYYRGGQRRGARRDRKRERERKRD